MSRSYIRSVLSIAAFKLNSHRTRQLEYIINAYQVTKDIPEARWGPTFYDKEFNRRSLFGHYTAQTIGEDVPLIRAQLMCSHLRAALNDFTTCEYEIGAVLEGIAPGPVPMADQGAAIPDFKAIAMALLEEIIAEYPTPPAKAHSEPRTRRVTRQLEHIRTPYKD